VIKFLRQVSSERLDELMFSSDYAEYIMDNCHGDRVICNGDTLLTAQEDMYLWEDFLYSKGIDPVAIEDEVYSPYYGA
jgi:hypothetical protein